jgi:hypothetical protein
MIEGLCGDVFQGATQTVPSLVTLVMGPTPVLPGNVTGVPTSSSLDIENDIAIGVGIPIALVAMVGFWISYRTMWKERFKDVTPTSEAL